MEKNYMIRNKAKGVSFYNHLLSTRDSIKPDISKQFKDIDFTVPISKDEEEILVTLKNHIKNKNKIGIACDCQKQSSIIAK